MELSQDTQQEDMQIVNGELHKEIATQVGTPNAQETTTISTQGKRSEEKTMPES
mgnify:CR=1 FL=1